jgi:hypothetical protein
MCHRIDVRSGVIVRRAVNHASRAMFAGFAPLIETALIGKFGTAPWVMPALFAALVCLLSAVSIYSMRETYDVPLDRLGR